jgi:hypothetical protein
VGIFADGPTQSACYTPFGGCLRGDLRDGSSRLRRGGDPGAEVAAYARARAERLALGPAPKARHLTLRRVARVTALFAALAVLVAGYLTACGGGKTARPQPTSTSHRHPISGSINVLSVGVEVPYSELFPSERRALRRALSELPPRLRRAFHCLSAHTMQIHRALVRRRLKEYGAILSRCHWRS